MKPITIALALAGLAAATPAFAAVDGTVGPTSTGTMQVSITLEAPPVPDVQIFGLDDIAFGPQQTDIFQIQSGRQFCMTRSDGGSVNLTITDNVGTGLGSFPDQSISFGLNDPSQGLNLPMTIDIFDGTGSGLTITEGTPVLFSASATCTEGGPEAFGISARIFVDPQDAPGSYSSTLTLLVAPT